MNLTHNHLEAAYEFLRTTTPQFKALPHADAIEFQITRDRICFGKFSVPPLRIAISSVRNAHTDTLLQTMAHEMLHLKQSLTKTETSGEHNAGFTREAKRIAHAHGFDPKAF